MATVDHKKRSKLADKYRTVVGFVQFDPNEREANGRSVRDIVVQQTGAEGTNIRVTLWPEFSKAKVEKGDFVGVSGKLTTRTVKGTTYLNLSAKDLFVNGEPVKAERGDDVEGALDDEGELTF